MPNNAENPRSGYLGNCNSHHLPKEARYDTVGIAFPITEDFDTEGTSVSISRFGTADESYKYNRKLEGGGFLGTGVGGMAWAEASLPKRASESNVDGVTTPELHELLVELHREACAFVEPDRSRDGHRVDMAKVVRLDLVRDFHGVRSAPYLLDGLSMVPQGGRAKVSRHPDPDYRRAETLSVGCGGWRATLYDCLLYTSPSPRD